MTDEMITALAVSAFGLKGFRIERRLSSLDGQPIISYMVGSGDNEFGVDVKDDGQALMPENVKPALHVLQHAVLAKALS